MLSPLIDASITRTARFAERYVDAKLVVTAGATLFLQAILHQLALRCFALPERVYDSTVMT